MNLPSGKPLWLSGRVMRKIKENHNNPVLQTLKLKIHHHKHGYLKPVEVYEVYEICPLGGMFTPLLTPRGEHSTI
jgi:hypothetical protein